MRFHLWNKKFYQLEKTEISRLECLSFKSHSTILSFLKYPSGLSLSDHILLHSLNLFMVEKVKNPRTIL